MSRSPIATLAGGKSPRQRIWEHIRAVSLSPEGGGACFTLADVTPGDVPRGTAQEYLAGLVFAGYLAQVEPTRRGVKNRYVLTRDAGIEAPRVRADGSEVTQGCVNEAMWGAIRVLDTFTAGEIATLAGATPATARTYCAYLARAGYLERGSTRERACYRTVKSRISGPRAPMITRIKAVYDPNLHRVAWMQGADEVALEALE